jgi:uncharacterized protein
MRFGAGNDDESNIEDRRGQGRSGIRLGLGGIVVVGVLSLVLRRNLFTALGTTGGSTTDPTARDGQRAEREASLRQTAVRSFNDAQRHFGTQLSSRSKTYKNTTLVLFWDETHSGCGAAGAEMGPFYCPADTKVYLDLGFYDDLERRFKAPGDFAQAYVIAHEVAHHVQNLLGIEAKMRSDQARASGNRKNDLSVRLELQADCIAGTWGHSANQRGMLDVGDVDEGLDAAAAIGDDRIQKMAGRRVAPESFTHGSSEMRVRWFRRGLSQGRIEDCDTFVAPTL